MKLFHGFKMLSLLYESKEYEMERIDSAVKVHTEKAKLQSW